MKPFMNQDYWVKLWNFVGEQIGKNFDVKLKVEVLSKTKFANMVKKLNNLLIRVYKKRTGKTRREVIDYLFNKRMLSFTAWTNPENVDAINFTKPLLKKYRLYRIVNQTLPSNPLSNHDVVIYINRSSIRNFNCKPHEVYTFLAIHEMLHAYMILDGKTGNHDEIGIDDYSAVIHEEWFRRLDNQFETLKSQC